MSQRRQGESVGDAFARLAHKFQVTGLGLPPPLPSSCFCFDDESWYGRFWDPTSPHYDEAAVNRMERDR